MRALFPKGGKRGPVLTTLFFFSFSMISGKLSRNIGAIDDRLSSYDYYFMIVIIVFIFIVMIIIFLLLSFLYYCCRFFCTRTADRHNPTCGQTPNESRDENNESSSG